jgi:hypothetical protein
MWLVNDRFDTDPAVSAAAEGWSFVDESGALKADLTPSEAQDLRAWATSLTGEEALLRDDFNSVMGGSGDASHVGEALSLEGRE